MCGDYNLRREKRYVEVDVRFTPDGKIRPLAINSQARYITFWRERALLHLPDLRAEAESLA